jgi:hypothetical protein
VNFALLLQAILVSAGVILSAPYTAVVRAWLRATFPGNFVTIVGSIVGVSVVVVLGLALTRIRDRRLFRYTLLVAGVIIGVSYARWSSINQPEVDVVEHFHFVEYGIIAMMFYRAFRMAGDSSAIVMPLLSGLTVGAMEEWFQWFIPNRVGELHDVAIDLVAVGCGLLVVLGAYPPESFRWRLNPGSLRRIGVGLLCGIGAVAFFVQQVHLGHEISEGGLTFRSHWTSTELHELARDRAERWKTNPPLTFARLSREDQYMDEALWHIRARNLAWPSNPFSAWCENRILEEYYAPVLDAPSYVSKTGHRWPDAQKVEVEQKAEGDRGPYVSHAEQYPILVF